MRAAAPPRCAHGRAVERDVDAVNLRLARAAGVPVLMAHAKDRAVLRRLHLQHARALVAMGSDELDNVEVVIAALAVAPGLRIVIRAGENDIIDETRSLFHIGNVRDVSALTAFAIVQRMLGRAVGIVYHDESGVRHVERDGGTVEPGRAFTTTCMHRSLYSGAGAVL